MAYEDETLQEDLNEDIEDTVEDALVMTVPIDKTLSISGEAADAYAVGKALEGKADKKDLETGISVNGQEADNQGLIIIDAGDIPLDKEEETPTTIREALEAADITAVTEAIQEMQATIEQLDGAAVKSVTAGGDKHTPDAEGDVKITEVELAQQLKSDRNIETRGEFIIRPSSGGGSISDGQATISAVYGRMRHDGYIPETLEMTLETATRPTPAAITVTLDVDVFEAYVENVGVYYLNYTDEWDHDPEDYGIAITGEPVSGDQIVIIWQNEGEEATPGTPYATVNAAPRHPAAPITAELDKEAFRDYVTESGIIHLYYSGSGWSEDPEDYGISISGEPYSGDYIRINYVAEDRGTILPAMITKITATGWNLYNASTGRARVCRYSDQYGYRITGPYTTLHWAETLEGERTQITPDEDGLFLIPGDGWLLIGGGRANTCVYTTWSDWISTAPVYEAYRESSVDLASAMAYFPAGLCSIGSVEDEINLNTQTAISRIERMDYSAENMAAVKAAGRAYDADRNYIYAARETPISYTIEIGAGYQVSEHGLEIAEGTEVPIYMAALYGPNLRDKLERMVVTYVMTVNELMEMGT